MTWFRIGIHVVGVVHSRLLLFLFMLLLKDSHIVVSKIVGQENDYVGAVSSPSIAITVNDKDHQRQKENCLGDQMWHQQHICYARRDFESPHFHVLFCSVLFVSFRFI